MAPVLLASPMFSFAAKALAVVVVALGLFGFGYYEGHVHAVNAEKAKIVTRVIVQARAVPGETKIIHDQIVKIKTIHDKVYVDVVKTVPDARACDLPASDIGLLNDNRNSSVPAAR